MLDINLNKRTPEWHATALTSTFMWWKRRSDVTEFTSLDVCQGKGEGAAQFRTSPLPLHQPPQTNKPSHARVSTYNAVIIKNIEGRTPVAGRTEWQKRGASYAKRSFSSLSSYRTAFPASNLHSMSSGTKSKAKKQNASDVWNQTGAASFYLLIVSSFFW